MWLHPNAIFNDALLQNIIETIIFWFTSAPITCKKNCTCVLFKVLVLFDLYWKCLKIIA